MDDFSCPVVRIETVSSIEDADEIELARFVDIDVIVPRGRYHIGDMAIYLPPDAVLPGVLASSLRGHAKLFGERRNRVRPYRLRGAFSEGILIGPIPCGRVGEDAAPALGIKKYEAPVPMAWRGECLHTPGMTIEYDIRNARRYPRTFLQGEQVDITEKLHGTMCAVGYMARIDGRDLPGGALVYSKGLARTGHVLKSGNETNPYVKTAMDAMLPQRIKAAFNGRPATVFGEIYGANIQDLSYGKSNPEFALFDVYLGNPGMGRWLDREEFDAVAGEIAPTAPTLYRGLLQENTLRDLGSGATVAGNGVHIREGIVVRPAKEREGPRSRRPIMKYVSPEYLTRANGTEFQ